MIHGAQYSSHRSRRWNSRQWQNTSSHQSAVADVEQSPVGSGRRVVVASDMATRCRNRMCSATRYATQKRGEFEGLSKGGRGSRCNFFAITKRPAFNRDPELRQQLRTSSGRIQTKGHLRRALGYGFISQDEYQTHWDMYDEVAAMLTGLRNYLDPNGQDR